MKTKFNATIFLLGFVILANGQSHFKVRNDEFIQLGHDNYKALSFGKQPGSPTPQNGEYAIEHSTFYGGLNFWKPWPTANSADQILFLGDDHRVSMGGMTITGFRLSVWGFIAATGIQFISDERLKLNIKPIDTPLEKLLKLEGISYDLDITKISEKSALHDRGTETKSKTGNIIPPVELAKDKLGFRAQNVQKVFPGLVSKSDNDILTVDYIGIIPVLVEAIKIQNSQIEELQLKLITLENKSTNSTLGGNNISSSGISSAILFQNVPNPFSVETKIGFKLPTVFNTATIQVYDNTGLLRSKFDLKGTDEYVILNAGSLQPGMYTYVLKIDGTVVDSKSMLIVNN